MQQDSRWRPGMAANYAQHARQSQMAAMLRRMAAQKTQLPHPIQRGVIASPNPTTEPIPPTPPPNVGPPINVIPDPVIGPPPFGILPPADGSPPTSFEANTPGGAGPYQDALRALLQHFGSFG